MARLMVAASMLAAVLSASTSSVQASDDPDVQASIDAAAALVGVEPIKLEGAMNTLSEPDPVEALRKTGDLPPQTASAVAPSGPPITGALVQARCIINRESGGLDVPNSQGSGADGPGQFFPSTWATDVALYRAATGYTGPLSLHSLRDVEAVMAFMLSAHPGSRTAWTVGGC